MLMKIQEHPDDNDPIDIPPSLLSTMETLSGETRSEMEQIDARRKVLRTNISSQFADLRKIPYSLHSVFFHRGSVTFGHYWIYIYDFARDMWRKYNDGYVTEVTDPSEIFVTKGPNPPATPYFVVYVADDAKESLVEPVCRKIVVEEVKNEQADVEMEDLPTEVNEIPGTNYSGTNSFTIPNLTQPPAAMVRPEGAWDSSGAF
jgi:ubiquitin carboxyl-terminal hydrolase 25